jgi:LPS sulfotransferase NodH
MKPSSQYKRPDLIDLIGPDFDYSAPEPPNRTLVICTGPRTGSFELSRYLMAAGIGVPHEYFQPFFAKRLAWRWGISNPLAEPGLTRYIDALRRRRTQGGVFAFKLGYSQFDNCLRNRHGAMLFESAKVVHLYRPDIAGQYASARIAAHTGIWDFSERRIQGETPRASGATALKGALFGVDALVNAETQLRKLFVLLGIHPLFITSDELFQNPRNVVQRIANSLGMPVNEVALEESIAHGGSYKRESKGQHTLPQFHREFKEAAFKKP